MLDELGATTRSATEGMSGLEVGQAVRLTQTLGQHGQIGADSVRRNGRQPSPMEP